MSWGSQCLAPHLHVEETLLLAVAALAPPTLWFQSRFPLLVWTFVLATSQSPLYPKALWCLAPGCSLFLYAFRLAPFFARFLIGGIAALPLFPIFSARCAGLNHPMPYSEGKPNPRCPPTNGLTRLLLWPIGLTSFWLDFGAKRSSSGFQC